MNNTRFIIVTLIVVLVVLLIAYIALYASRVQQTLLARPITPSTSPVTTLTPTQAILPTSFELAPGMLPIDTFDQALYDAETRRELIEDPDVVIHNRSPYDGGTFAVRSEYVPAGRGSFKIIVETRSSISESKADFITWIKSMGLTDESISKVQIEYQSQ